MDFKLCILFALSLAIVVVTANPLAPPPPAQPKPPAPKEPLKGRNGNTFEIWPFPATFFFIPYFQ